MTGAALILVVLGGLLLPQFAHAAPALIACMTAHKNEMKELNTQIAELQQMKVAPGGPKVKQGDCVHRLKAIHGSALSA